MTFKIIILIVFIILSIEMIALTWAKCSIYCARYRYQKFVKKNAGLIKVLEHCKLECERYHDPSTSSVDRIGIVTEFMQMMTLYDKYLDAHQSYVVDVLKILQFRKRYRFLSFLWFLLQDDLEPIDADIDQFDTYRKLYKTISKEMKH